MRVNENIPKEVGRIKKIKIFEVTEDELLLLKNGSDGSLYLNFAIAILTSSLSALLVHLTVNNLNFKVQAFLYGVMFSGFVIGILFAVVWYRKGSNTNEILERIEARIRASQEKIKEPIELPNG